MNCCNGNCNQGRDCSNRRRMEGMRALSEDELKAKQLAEAHLMYNAANSSQNAEGLRNAYSCGETKVIDVPFKEVKRSLWARIPPIVKGAILAAIWFALSNGLFK